ncbi:hypothetical protein LUZ61_002011 [Rhynchospora tenuis]|uniref:Uncharacterized protein n=1 Tax=Rhynchospora tenuis TaxID=198213 RepID=A0AAD6ERE8_9POAL|nr:hypothetical protein LUZ61_002011 [Rhynchospora tenuis]
MSRRRDGSSSSTDDEIVTSEEGIRTLSRLMMMDDADTEEDISEAFMSDKSLGHKTIFMFPAIMEIRQQRAKVVAIGPYNHKEEMLYFGLDYKWQILKLMTQGFQLDTGKFLGNMAKKELELRNCYEEEVEDLYQMATKDFLQIMLLDGCFILFALKCLDGKNQSSFDTVELFLSKFQGLGNAIVIYQLITNVKNLVSQLEMHRESVICDLLLMENQIPFSVLQELLCLCPDFRDFVGSSIKDLALSSFKCVRPKMNKELSEQPEEFLHLLDVFHWSRVPEDKYKLIDNQINNQTMPGVSMLRATEFHHSGVRLKRKKSGSYLDVVIKNSSSKKDCVIKVPAIDIKNYQFSIFESLVTFEERYEKRGVCFTAFVECMASLLGSENDAKLLQKCGIIPKDTDTSDDYVIKFFHQLSHCIKPVALMPHPYEGYKSAVDRVRETVEKSKATEARCWFRF